MNRSFSRTVFACVIVLMLLGCRKDDTIFDSFFFASWNDSQGPLTLHIDDEFKGELPFISSRPTCENDSLKQMALHLSLKSGKYKIAVKDQQGVVKSSCTISISGTKTSSSGSIGGQEVTVVGDCALFRFMH